MGGLWLSIGALKLEAPMFILEALRLRWSHLIYLGSTRHNSPVNCLSQITCIIIFSIGFFEEKQAMCYSPSDWLFWCECVVSACLCQIPRRHTTILDDALELLIKQWRQALNPVLCNLELREGSLSLKHSFFKKRLYIHLVFKGGSLGITLSLSSNASPLFGILITQIFPPFSADVHLYPISENTLQIF